MEQTLVLIKPDGIKNTNPILDMLTSNGLSIEEWKSMLLDEEIVDEHYSHLLDKPFYPKLKAYMTSSEIIALILSGEDAVNKTRKIVGATDPQKAEKGTIRNLYGTDVTYNAVHASDSVENAQKEINRFFRRDKKLSKTIN